MIYYGFAIILFIVSCCSISCRNVLNVCPMPKCQGKIPKDCRKAEYVIGADFKTRCRMCDSSICGKKISVCPALDCPNDRKIKDECRRPNFVIGTDGITKCRVCDSSLCGKKYKVCPVPKCPNMSSVPRKCLAKRYTIGRDGITKCRLCDRDICKPQDAESL